MNKAVLKKQLLICFLSIAIVNAQAQQKIKDGTIPATPSLPAAGSLLELESNSRGLRIPQIALTNTTTWLPLVGSGGAATSPGMTVYNTNAGIASTNTNFPALGIGEYYWNGTGWVVKNPLAAAAYIEPWYNVATSAGATTNTQNIYQMGNIGVGTNAPNCNLHVAGTIRAMPGGAFTGDIILGTASNDGIQLLSTGSTAYLGVQRSSNGGNLYLTKDIGTGAQLNYVLFNRSGTTIGSISSLTGTNISFNTTSDTRLKENIRATQYGLTDLMKIQVTDYNYKTENKTRATGFLAQDLYKIYPVAVTPGGEDENTNPWMIDYSKMTPLLVKAIQDQQAQIEKQQTINEKQQAIIEKLEARLKVLEERK